MLYTVHGLVDLYLSKTLLLYCYMTKCVDNAREMFELFNLMEIALRQLLHAYYKTEGGDRLLCLGYHNFFICAFGFKAGLFIQYLAFFSTT